MATPHDRNGCALQGATLLIGSIGGAVPVLHAQAGCGVAIGHAGRSIASTTLVEKQVVFGGTSRLREQIKNTIQVQAGEIFVVLAGCVPEIIGDDLPAMIKEAREQGFPVIGIAVPGFRGHAWSGYATTARALLEQLPASRAGAVAAAPADVNLLGIAPVLDPGWDGDLKEIEAVLAEIGLRTNRLVGSGQDVRAWNGATQARLSVVLSPWGAEAAAWLQQRHAVPALDFGWLPVGSLDAGLLLGQVGSRLGIDGQVVVAAQARLNARLRQVLRGASERGLLDHLQQRAVVVAASAAAVGQARFLSGTLGLLVEQVVITDVPPQDCRAALVAAVRAATDATVSFIHNRDEIDRLLHAAKPELIVGSALEAAAASSLGAAHLEAAAPLWRRPMLGRAHAGVRGAVTLVEDLIAAVREAPTASTVGAASEPVPVD